MLIRTHLEYCSAIQHSASKTQLNKLDIIQKIAARVICEAPRDAHAALLLETLNLDSLDKRREHILTIVQNFVDGNCHPAFSDYFKVESDNTIVSNSQSRIHLGERRFNVVAGKVYNQGILSKDDANTADPTQTY